MDKAVDLSACPSYWCYDGEDIRLVWLHETADSHNTVEIMTKAKTSPGGFLGILPPQPGLLRIPNPVTIEGNIAAKNVHRVYGRYIAESPKVSLYGHQGTVKMNFRRHLDKAEVVLRYHFVDMKLPFPAPEPCTRAYYVGYIVLGGSGGHSGRGPKGREHSRDPKLRVVLVKPQEPASSRHAPGKELPMKFCRYVDNVLEVRMTHTVKIVGSLSIICVTTRLADVDHSFYHLVGREGTGAMTAPLRAFFGPSGEVVPPKAVVQTANGNESTKCTVKAAASNELDKVTKPGVEIVVSWLPEKTIDDLMRDTSGKRAVTHRGGGRGAGCGDVDQPLSDAYTAAVRSAVAKETVSRDVSDTQRTTAQLRLGIDALMHRIMAGAAEPPAPHTPGSTAVVPMYQHVHEPGLVRSGPLYDGPSASYAWVGDVDRGRGVVDGHARGEKVWRLVVCRADARRAWFCGGLSAVVGVQAGRPPPRPARVADFVRHVLRDIAVRTRASYERSTDDERRKIATDFAVSVEKDRSAHADLAAWPRAPIVPTAPARDPTPPPLGPGAAGPGPAEFHLTALAYQRAQVAATGAPHAVGMSVQVDTSPLFAVTATGAGPPPDGPKRGRPGAAAGAMQMPHPMLLLSAGIPLPSSSPPKFPLPPVAVVSRGSDAQAGHPAAAPHPAPGAVPHTTPHPHDSVAAPPLWAHHTSHALGSAPTAPAPGFAEAPHRDASDGGAACGAALPAESGTLAPGGAYCAVGAVKAEGAGGGPRVAPNVPNVATRPTPGTLPGAAAGLAPSPPGAALAVGTGGGDGAGLAGDGAAGSGSLVTQVAHPAQSPHAAALPPYALPFRPPPSRSLAGATGPSGGVGVRAVTPTVSPPPPPAGGVGTPPASLTPRAAAPAPLPPATAPPPVTQARKRARADGSHPERSASADGHDAAAAPPRTRAPRGVTVAIGSAVLGSGGSLNALAAEFLRMTDGTVTTRTGSTLAQ